MFENIGWIVEAQIADGKHSEFKGIVEEIVAATRAEGGTLNYQYYVTDDGAVLVYERFANADSAHTHISNWDNFAERWLAAAPATRMVYLGDIPQDIKDRHAAISTKEYKPFNGFAR
ncbi:putative quinol monooxygenase [Pacificoceanicola onchidii]|uniref:putative quinol monooxygenase n=1 Tax=Pacificoceanicola onchidii TaxID=2562685 RepID=UPI0010A54FFF|nr:antibiotic biosynthesis monooxygenase [Pacificoceanicola onchidii]